MTHIPEPPNPNMPLNVRLSVLNVALLVGVLVAGHQGANGVTWTLLGIQLTVLAVQFVLLARYLRASRRWSKQWVRGAAR